MNNKVIVPDIGDFENVEIIEILVKSGDRVKKNDSIVTLESDKSSVEVPSTAEGKIESINVKIGDKVSKGDLLISVLGEETKFKDEEKKYSKDKLPTDTEKRNYSHTSAIKYPTYAINAPMNGKTCE